MTLDRPLLAGVNSAGINLLAATPGTVINQLLPFHEDYAVLDQ